MREIADCLPDGGDWCTLEKAQTMASLVVGLRPRVVCEIGVWMGGSLIPTALAVRAVQCLEHEGRTGTKQRKVVAIDPWSVVDSCAGQAPEDQAWWSGVDHEVAYQAFVARVAKHGLESLCEVVRARSDDAPIPPIVDLLHVDGNHADQAVKDVGRFARVVPVGGVLVLDDVRWSGGHVARAHELARSLGFVDLYPMDTGVVMQRTSLTHLTETMARSGS